VPRSFVLLKPLHKGPRLWERKMVDIESGSRSRVGNFFRGAIRALLHPIFKVIALIAIGIRAALRPRIVRYPAIALLLVVGALWVVSAQSRDDMSSFMLPEGTVVSAPHGQYLAAPQAVEQYLLAQGTRNAPAMWATLSEEFRSAMADDPEAAIGALQAELDRSRQEGRGFHSATYIGGSPLNDGHTAYFYVVNIQTPEGVVGIPYIFVLDSTGRIASIQ
jgi:hypothetical protein